MKKLLLSFVTLAGLFFTANASVPAPGTPLSSDGTNLFVSEFEDFDDDVKIDIFITMHTQETDYGTVGPGWGCGWIKDINWSYDGFEVKWPDGVEDGEDAVFSIPVSKLKDIAKAGGSDYVVASWGGTGVVFHLWNGAEFKKAQVAGEAEPASADELSLKNLNGGWNSSYDSATKTITFEGEWTGKGWYYGSKDCSEYESVTVDFAPISSYAQLCIEYGYKDSDGKAIVGSVGIGETGTSITTPFDKQYADKVVQIYLQSSTAGTITLKSATLNYSSVTVSEAGYATVCLGYTARIPSGVTVYTAKLTEFKGGVVLSEYTDSNLPANTPVIIKAAPGSYSFAKHDTSVAPVTDNDLQGSNQPVSQTSAASYYVLANGSAGVGFYKLKTSDKVPANKAYVMVSGTSAARIAIEGITGIEDVQTQTESQIFDIDGHSMKNVTSGFYVINGKKTLVK